MSPVIPTLAAIARVVENAQEVMSHGKRHSVPSKDKDIALLMSTFMDDRVHIKIIGRHTKTTAKDVPVNVIVAGISKLIHKNGLDKWWSDRVHQEKVIMLLSTQECWECRECWEHIVHFWSLLKWQLAPGDAWSTVLNLHLGSLRVFQSVHTITAIDSNSLWCK